MTRAADPDGPIGVVAEGWEGVRGAELLQAELPREDVLVVADQAFAPYARRRPDQVRERVRGLADGLLDEGAKALLLAAGHASFAGRPDLGPDVPVRGLEAGLRRALADAAGGGVACVFAVEEVQTMVLARAIRGLRGGGTVTLVERGADDPAALVARCRALAPDARVLLLLTPAAYADADAVRDAADIAVVDALEAAAGLLAHDIRRRRLLARHGLRSGRVTAYATRGGTTGFAREPLSTASVAALQRRR